MDEWAISTYGDPCRSCTYRWSLTLQEATDTVRGSPARYSAAVAGATGRERRPDLDWSVTAYVCHVADNLRIWAERLQGVLLGGDDAVRAYDENLLAAARGYDAVSLPAALWSLARSAEDWAVTVGEAAGVERVGGHPVRLRHPDRGDLALVEVARANAHDAAHHLWDVRRILSARS